jgi:ribonucleoside-diphosphate reductase beta chain
MFDTVSTFGYDRQRPAMPRGGAHQRNGGGGGRMGLTLDELALQGDPGTLDSDEQAAKLKLMTPRELYLLWERQHWLSQDIDFSKDKKDWQALSGEEREQAIWGMAAFFIGEERVTTQFSGLVMSYDDENEASFLASQQVDEARHCQFFDRFHHEVMGIDEADLTARLNAMREHVNDSFVLLFDEVLADAERRLVANPRDIEAKVDFVTIYHMVIEGTLALTGQRFITDYYEREGIMPGFVEGFAKVARDEHRHVAYGTWYLKETAGRDKALAERMRKTLIELLPVAAGVLVPPGYDPHGDWELLGGYSSAEVNGFAFQCLTRRLKAIGVPLNPELVAV